VHPNILKLVHRYVAQFILERFVGDAELDGATAFYVYNRLNNLKQMPYDTANLIAKSLDIDLKDMEKKGLMDAVKSGKAKGVKVLSYREKKSRRSKNINRRSSSSDVRF